MMRRNLLVGVLSLLATVAWTQTNVRNRVEVVYFYGKQRCQTCMAIEKYAHEVVDQDFAVEKKKGKVVFNPSLTFSDCFFQLFSALRFFICGAVYYKLFSILTILNGIFLYFSRS